jgi:protein-disulfide isomerase
MFEPEAATLVPAVGLRDHVHGREDAAVTLVEYGDYECPHCGRAYPIVKRIQKHLGSQLRFVFRNFPLSQVHPHAQQAAEAAEAAGAQGSFWEMHDALFAHQRALTDRHLQEYASAIGIDVVRFREELSEQRHAPHVHDDFLSGVRSGVNGTPTFFINGVRYDDTWEFEPLAAALEAAAVASSASGHTR